MDKDIVYRVEDGMDREKILCTTYQMRNFYMQFRDGFFTNLDVMNYIQHLAAAHMAKKGMNVLDVCCGRSLMLPLLRYYAKDIASYTGVDISKANIKEAMRGATAKNLEPKDLTSYYPFRVGWKLGNVAEMSKVIPVGFADFVIYTSAIEHMHPTDGAKSLAECYKVMKPGAKMFLSCPNTPGNGYQTQYRAHVYEWGYTTIRPRIFLRARRQYIRAKADVSRNGYVPVWRSYKLVSYNGYFDWTKSRAISEALKQKKLFTAAKVAIRVTTQRNAMKKVRIAA